MTAIPTRTWSKSEKAIARTALDAALGRELQEVIQKATQMANQIQQSSDLWDLEHYLTERRREIDPIYRYSQLTHVFGRLLHEGRGSEEELRGLRQRQTEVDSFYCATVCEVCSLTWILSADGVISSK